MQNLEELENVVLARHRDKGGLDIDTALTQLERLAANIITDDELKKLLNSGRRLRVKFGIDPTAPSVHLGHLVPVRALRIFQELGHEVVLILGTFTSLVGDPSGRVSERPILTDTEIETNLKTYQGQFGKVLNIDKTTFVRNDSFYTEKSVADFLRFLRKVNIGPLLQREDFRQRLTESGLTAAELIYPMLMALDSVELKADIELGGEDQLLNFTITRDVMKAHGQTPEVILTTPFLLGTSSDGAKMSKSKGNTINVTDPPADVFGKIMSLPDTHMAHYFQLLTDLTAAEWQALERDITEDKLHPRDVKRFLGRLIVTLLYDTKAAKIADQAFTAVFTKGGLPADLPPYTLPAEALTLAQLLTNSGLTDSNSQARRLIEQGGVEKHVTADQSERLTDPNRKIDQNWRGAIIRCGKHRFLKLV